MPLIGSAELGDLHADMPERYLLEGPMHQPVSLPI